MKCKKSISIRQFIQQFARLKKRLQVLIGNDVHALGAGLGPQLGTERGADELVAFRRQPRRDLGECLGDARLLGVVELADPDGDAVSFEISTEPVKGSIELGEDGSFVYTPRENKRGRDYFGYRATDSESNVSQEATVIIRIEKQKKDVVYSDMIGCADG